MQQPMMGQPPMMGGPPMQPPMGAPGQQIPGQPPVYGAPGQYAQQPMGTTDPLMNAAGQAFTNVG